MQLQEIPASDGGAGQLILRKTGIQGHVLMISKIFVLTLAMLTLPSLVSAQDKEGIEFEKNALELSFDSVDDDVKTVIGWNFGIDF